MTLIQDDGHRDERGHWDREADRPRGKAMWGDAGEDGHLQAEETALSHGSLLAAPGTNRPADPWSPDFWPPELREDAFLWLQSLVWDQSWVPIHARPCSPLSLCWWARDRHASPWALRSAPAASARLSARRAPSAWPGRPESVSLPPRWTRGRQGQVTPACPSLSLLIIRMGMPSPHLSRRVTGNRNAVTRGQVKILFKSQRAG